MGTNAQIPVEELLAVARVALDGASESLTTLQVAEATGWTPSSARKYLLRMFRAGMVRMDREGNKTLLWALSDG